MRSPTLQNSYECGCKVQLCIERLLLFFNVAMWSFIKIKASRAQIRALSKVTSKAKLEHLTP